MKQIKVLEETEDNILLKVENDSCPYCESKNLRNKGNITIRLSKKCITDFISKDVTIKKVKYTCKSCNKTFTEKTFFKNIEDMRFKDYLKILLDRNIIRTFKVNEIYKKELKLDDDWVLLNENKILTLLNIRTLEIKEFIKLQKNKKEKVIVFNDFKRKGR